MRWLVFFLVVLNGLTFAWFSFQQQQQAHEQLRADQAAQFDFEAVPSLTLLSEMPQNERERRDMRKVIEPMQPAQLTVGEPQTDEKPADAQIADEMADGQEKQTGAENICAVIGSFPEVVSARQAKLTLDERGMPAKIVVRVKTLPAISWVYIPPSAGRKEALALLKDLQSSGVDSFLVSEGEYANAISLGFFSNRDSAEGIVRERREQGYNAQLTMRERERRSYWVAVTSLTSRLNDNLLASLSVDGNTVKKQEISCAEVALLEVIH